MHDQQNTKKDLLYIAFSSDFNDYVH